MKKASIIIVCCILLAFSCVAASNFSDLVTNHWAYNEITKLVEDGVINGYKDGTFRPDANVTKGEFIKLVVSACMPKEFDYNGITKDFNHWAAPHIKLAELYGVLEEGKINPENVDDYITRIEMASIIAMADIAMKDNEFDNRKELEFTDIFGVIDKPRTLLQHAYNRGLVKGNPDGTFNPNGNMLRSEAAMMIHRLSY